MDLSLLLKGLIIAGATAIGVGSTLLLKLKHDNPIEEVSEVIIKDQSGVDIDLTPSSPESKE